MAKTKPIMKASIVYKTPERKPRVAVPNVPNAPKRTVPIKSTYTTMPWQRKLTFPEEK